MREFHPELNLKRKWHLEWETLLFDRFGDHLNRQSKKAFPSKCAVLFSIRYFSSICLRMFLCSIRHVFPFK